MEAIWIVLLAMAATVVSLVLAFLRLREAGPPRAAAAFLLAAPWAVLGLDIVAFMFWDAPGTRLVALAWSPR